MEEDVGKKGTSTYNTRQTREQEQHTRSKKQAQSIRACIAPRTDTALQNVTFNIYVPLSMPTHRSFLDSTGIWDEPKSMLIHDDALHAHGASMMEKLVVSNY